LTAGSAKPAVFLDRDGVLNEAIVRNAKPYPPRDLSELVIASGAGAALEELKREGFLLIVVTNQPDIARGKATRADVDQINARLAAILPLDAIEAGRRAGCRTILIGDGYGETFPSAPTIKLASLPGAASWIIQQGRHEREIT